MGIFFKGFVIGGIIGILSEFYETTYSFYFILLLGAIGMIVLFYDDKIEREHQEEIDEKLQKILRLLKKTDD